MTAVRRSGILPAAVAATVALASGCLLESKPPQGSVALYWTFWSQSLGDIGAFTDDATPVCSRAAVDDVRITLTAPAGDPLRTSTHPCIAVNDVPGAAFAELEPGTWGYTFEARRGGVAVFEGSGDFEVRDGERTIEDLRALPLDGHWDVVVNYATGACAAGDRLRFDVVDQATLAVIFSTDDASVNPEVVVPCDDSLPFTLPAVKPGDYRFSDWVHVDASGAPVAYSTCRPSWTQSALASMVINGAASVDVSAVAAPPIGNPGVCP